MRPYLFACIDRGGGGRQACVQTCFACIDRGGGGMRPDLFACIDRGEAGMRAKARF